jgi:hypothetical protein
MELYIFLLPLNTLMTSIGKTLHMSVRILDRAAWDFVWL